MKLSAEIAENDRYLEEADKSADRSSSLIQLPWELPMMSRRQLPTPQAVVRPYAVRLRSFSLLIMIVEYADNVARNFKH